MQRCRDGSDQAPAPKSSQSAGGDRDRQVRRSSGMRGAREMAPGSDCQDLNLGPATYVGKVPNLSFLLCKMGIEIVPP